MRHVDYDKSVDGLTKKVVDAMDGEDLWDVAQAAAAVMTFALNAMDPERRDRARMELGKFLARLNAASTT